LKLSENFLRGAAMLSEISIRNEGSYGDSTQSLSGLREINFIFGTNGSGKTTIARVIADPASKPSCGIAWKGQLT
jgi:ABC-type polysaccharide/polyol phosphate transport system ATPase subunit